LYVTECSPNARRGQVEKAAFHTAGQQSPAAVLRVPADPRGHWRDFRAVYIRKDHPPRVASAQKTKLSGFGFALGRAACRGFDFGGHFLPLQIGIPSFPLLSFVVLLAHNALLSERIPIV
jgi:hypothetical protein